MKSLAACLFGWNLAFLSGDDTPPLARAVFTIALIFSVAAWLRYDRKERAEGEA